MSARIPFVKMHGLGNDFVVLDDRVLPKGAVIDPEFAKKICDRRFGVGADQILHLREPHEPGADARMEILNADGTIAEMCGNGIRAVGLYLRERRPELASREVLKIETLAGRLEVRAVGSSFRVNMGVPQLGGGFAGGAGESLDVRGKTHKFFEVSMGNPHAVFFDESLDQLPELGPEIERHVRFPRRTNVEFVTREEGALRVRVWERGAGLTLACGTGACAVAVAALALGRVMGSAREVEIRLPGGNLSIAWEGAGKPVYMEGPASTVFAGEYLA